MDATSPPPAPETGQPRPLLPLLLLRPGSLLWLWVLPVGLLLALNLHAYSLIEGNLSSTQRCWAHAVGGAGLADLVLGLLFYGGLRWTAKTRLARVLESAWWGLAFAAVQIGYLWLATLAVDRALPASVTAWIYPPERFLFNQFAFAMPPLFLGVLRMAGARPAGGTARSVFASLGCTLGAPLVLYVLLHLLRLGRDGTSFEIFVFAAALVVLGMVMFVGLVRVLLVGLRATLRWGRTGERLAIVLFALVLPLGGMLLNRSIPFPVDFQAWEVYALVFANTAILLLASWQHETWPRASLLVLCLTLPFSLYFFLVFLPYTPLSILAVLAVGSGFLVLTPTFLFTLHLHLLNKACRPAGGTAGLPLLTGALASVLLLPAFFAVRGLADKAALNAALDHLYTPALESPALRYPGSRLNLRRALANHRDYKDGIYYPILSDFYAWLVFDNLVLPDEKLARLEQVFFGAQGTQARHDPVRRGFNLFGRDSSVRTRAHMPRANPPPRSVVVRDLATRVRGGGEDNAVLTLALTLENNGGTVWGGAEYVQTLPLPAGVFVCGFRLHMNGTPVPGRIFEKKTALWVYTMIRDSERRDPGLLLHRSPTELELRVFPVNHGAPATVEVDFLLPQAVEAAALPASRDPAGVLAVLGGLLRPALTTEGSRASAAGGFDRLGLPALEREPYLHLIVDRSAGNGFEGDLSAALAALRARFPDVKRGRVTLAGSDVVDLEAGLTPLAALAAHDEHSFRRVLPRGGGFAFDLALAHALRLHRDRDLDAAPAGVEMPPQPVFIVLRQKPGSAAPALGIAAAWTDLVPALAVHEQAADGSLTTWSTGAATAPLLRLGRSLRPLVPGRALHFAAAGPEAGALEFRDPGRSQWTPVPGVHRQPAETPWSRAALLQGLQHEFERSPGGPATSLRELVRASRASGILLASTSYIAVENEAQWRMLGLAEDTKLGQNKALDFLETPAPPGAIVALGYALWWLARRLRAKRRIHGREPVRGVVAGEVTPRRALFQAKEMLPAALKGVTADGVVR